MIGVALAACAANSAPSGLPLSWLPHRSHSLAGMTGAIALVGTLSYILCFALGAGPVPGLLVPEITAARIRGVRHLGDALRLH